MKEIWKDIENTNKKYEVSTYGRVRNKKTGFILKPRKRPDGYIDIDICGKKPKIHRLVAQAFIPNPDNKPEVNHIDENKQNNNINNLNWMTHIENINWGTAISRMLSNQGHIQDMKKRMVAVVGKDINGNEYFFESVNEAARETKVYQGNISACINGRRKTAGGYVWTKVIC